MRRRSCFGVKGRIHIGLLHVLQTGKAKNGTMIGGVQEMTTIGDPNGQMTPGAQNGKLIHIYLTIRRSTHLWMMMMTTLVGQHQISI